jgi:hypothetical protein
MSNLAKVVQHFKEGNGASAEQTRSIGRSFKSVDRVSGVGGSNGISSLVRRVRKAQDRVGRRTETDRGGATCALVEVESYSANERNGTSFSTFPFTDISFSA